MSLQNLRDKITVIFQIPTLFTGTLRENLDPEGNSSNEDIEKLLRQAGLTKLLSRDKGLQQRIEKNGQNFSSGEKQLICFCRAILRKRKIIVMDEATANVDVNVEKTIKELFNQYFHDCTVLIITHRLTSVVKFDKKVELDKGKVIQSDESKDQLDNQGSKM